MKFIKSAAQANQAPEHNLMEIAFAGRSNAGKSSFINALSGQKKLAKVSKAPGKTRLLNFFDVESKYCLVDMPGYGYAARAKGERSSWRQMVEGYLNGRRQLGGLLLFMDIRRDWSEDEENLRLWLEDNDIPMAVVLTKKDKLNQKELHKNMSKIKELKLGIRFFACSSSKKQGLLEVEDFIYKEWVEPFRAEKSQDS